MKDFPLTIKKAKLSGLHDGHVFPLFDGYNFVSSKRQLDVHTGLRSRYYKIERLIVKTP